MPWTKALPGTQAGLGLDSSWSCGMGTVASSFHVGALWVLIRKTWWGSDSWEWEGGSRYGLHYSLPCDVLALYLKLESRVRSPLLHTWVQGHHVWPSHHLMGTVVVMLPLKMSTRPHVTALSYKGGKDTEGSRFWASKLDTQLGGTPDLWDLLSRMKPCIWLLGAAPRTTHRTQCCGRHRVGQGF